MSEVVRAAIDGLPYLVSVPDGTPPEGYEYGLVVGPPQELLDLELDCTDILRRLHTELYVRGLITRYDLQKRSGDVVAAIQAVLKLDANRIIEVYNGGQ